MVSAFSSNLVASSLFLIVMAWSQQSWSWSDSRNDWNQSWYRAHRGASSDYRTIAVVHIMLPHLLHPTLSRLGPLQLLCQPQLLFGLRLLCLMVITTIQHQCMASYSRRRSKPHIGAERKASAQAPGMSWTFEPMNCCFMVPQSGP